MKYILPLSCIFSASILLSACQTNSLMNPLMPDHLTKAQCIEAGITFDQNELAAARLAKKRATTPQVRHYANYIHNHYTSDLHKKLNVVRKEHIKLETSNTTSDLQNRGKSEMARLEASSRADFDKNYIHESIKDHEGAIEYFDGALRNETDPHEIHRLKELRRQAEVCLKKAQHINQNMGQ
ncbi:MAG: DUF4142 domain-containing protein [Gammaproteobacteria bacterium]|nr:DUF4142 domain-containing protein [Gammaproteobacteria bacterium]